MTNNVEQLTREVHELKLKIVQERHECTQEQSKEFVSEEKEQKKKNLQTIISKWGIMSLIRNMEEK